MHFITTNCYKRQPLLGSAQARDLFLQVLEQIRRMYGFVVVGYVVMPEHVHLLISEPRRGSISTVMQALKQSFTHKVIRRVKASINSSPGSLWNMPLDHGHVWQRRFYDFMVFTHRKRVEKLRYMHRNPVKRGLVLEPQQWPWSSYQFYACDEQGPVLVNEQQTAEMVIRKLA